MQSSHACINFIFENHNKGDPWFYSSNTLVQLEVKNEEQLKLLIEKCQFHQLDHTVFREPDLGNAITAIAIEPSDRTRRLTSNIPKLFKNKINKDVSTNKNNGYESQSS